MTLYIAPIVEGQTEQQSLVRLLRRVWFELLSCTEHLEVLTPARRDRGVIIQPSGEAFGKMVEDAFLPLARRIQKDSSGRGMVLVVLDAEGECPKELAPRLLEQAQKARSDADIACVLAKRMFENWIVAGASTLAGINDLPDLLPARDRIEERSGVAWLEKQLRSKNQSRPYKKTLDAKVFVQSISLTECRSNSPSFDKLCRELEKRLPLKADDAGETTKE